MNEIKVSVNQTIGEIQWNYEYIKEMLKKELDVYKNTVYTDDTIKTAKTDIAELRKLKEEISTCRKRIKSKCLEPYEIIESQAKELTDLIDEPIDVINMQVQDYETRRREAVKKEITEYMDSKIILLPDELQEKARTKIYDTRWENVTSSKKAYRDGIDAGVQGILNDLETIRSFNSEFEEDMMAVYSEELVLTAAIMKMNQLNKQKERVLEVERRKKEAEEEARRKAEEEAASQQADAEGVDADSSDEADEADEEPNVTAVQTEAPEKKQPTDNQVTIMTLRIKGRPDQMEKIKGFIRYAGADYEEISL